MRELQTLLWPLALLFAPVLAQAEPPDIMRAEAEASAAWETPVQVFPGYSECNEYLPRDRIAPVIGEYRSEAIERLAGSQAIEISYAEAAQLTHDALNERSDAHPFLVRAVAKNEAVAFSVRMCGDLLHVVHGSLGRGPAPPSHRVPLVVLLDRPPTGVVVTWAIAE